MNDNLPLRTDLAPIATDEAHVWKVRLDIGATRFDKHLELLAADERRRVDEFQLDAPRRRFAIARAALRMLLGRYLHVSPVSFSLGVGRNGKPQLESHQNRFDLRFNLAHSGNLALIAVTQFCEVGIDVEQLRTVRYAAQIAQRFFHPAEIQTILTAPAAERDATFLRCWTAKEALLKAIGIGITGSLAEFSVPFDFKDDTGVEVPTKLNDNRRAVCWLERLDIDVEYLAAIAFVESRRKVRLLEFEW